jgi:hypothetical protein
MKLTEILNEIGEGVNTYPFKQITAAKHAIAYTFTTDTKEQYIVKFKANDAQPNVYYLSFYPGTSASDSEEDNKIDVITNKGTMFKILSTVVGIVKSVIAKNKDIEGINWVGVNSDKEGAGEQRARLYNAYLEKNISHLSNWKVVPGTVVTKLRKITTKK